MHPSRLPGRPAPRRSHVVALVKCFVIAAFCLLQAAAALAGEIRGRVLGPGDTPLPNVTLTLSNDLTGFSQQAVSEVDGSFIFYNLPNNPYRLEAKLEGVGAARETVTVRGGVPIEKTLHLAPSFSDTTTVTADKENVAVESDDATTHTDIDKSLIRRFPAAVASRAFEQIVLSAPGFSQDENGRYHFQGGHSQQLVVIDGQPIGDQVGITFSNSLDPAIVQGIEIVTGGTPAEYGEKAYGVINLTTRSALGQGGFHGDATLGAASFSTGEAGATLGWGGKSSGLFVSLDGSRSDRFLDPLTFDNLHNQGNNERLFLRYDLLSGGGSDSFRLTSNGGRTDRDVPNLPSQAIAGQSERVHTQDWNLNLGYQHVGGSDLVYEGQVYGRDNRLRLLSSPEDTPVIAAQDRKLDNQGINAAVSKAIGASDIKVGVQLKRFPIQENFSFLIVDPGFNDPASDAFNPNLLPYDGTRGGSPFLFQGSKTGRYIAAYGEDTFRVQNLTVNAGLRYDNNNLFLTESQLQPRVGAAYFLPRTNTVLRVSYDRMFITPEYENILVSSSPQGTSLAYPQVRDSAQLGFGHLFNVSERHNAYNAGVQQAVGNKLRIDASWWKRQVRNAADQDQFFNTGIVFPLNFAKGDLSGWNLRLDGGPYNGLRGYLSLGHVHALYSPPFVGGLFLGQDALSLVSGGPFLIDHDQDLQEQVGLFYDIPNTGFWAGLTQRYDSGLVTDAGSPADVLSSLDTAYAEPYINFSSTPQRIKPRSIVNLSLGSRLKQYGLPLELQFDVLNVADKKGLYNFQSTFGGTHVIPPRTFAGRIRVLI